MNKIWTFCCLLALFSACRNNTTTTTANPDSNEVLVAYQDKNDLYGFKTLKGKVAIPAQFSMSFTDTFQHKIAFVVDKTKGIIAINKSGAYVLTPFVYDNGPDYLKEGLFRFVENKKMGFADINGTVKIPARYDFVTEFSEGLACFGKDYREQKQGEHTLLLGGTWGFITTKGDTAIKAKYEGMSSFENGTAIVKFRGQTLEIDKSGNPIR